MKKQPIKKRKPAQQKITELDIMEARIELLEDEIQNLQHYVSVQYSNRISTIDIDNAIAAAGRIIKTDEKIKRSDMDTAMEINDYNSLMAGKIKEEFVPTVENVFDKFLEFIRKNDIIINVSLEATGLLLKTLMDEAKQSINTHDIRIQEIHKSIEKTLVK